MTSDGSTRPLSTAECADVIGVSTDFIRDAIRDGHLAADRIDLPGKRPFYRVHEDDFVRFLVRVKWTRIPSRFASIASALTNASGQSR